MVLPYARLQQGDEQAVSQLLNAVRRACPGLTLKVILETGMLADDAQAAGRVGFKPSGGIRTVADAAVYIALCEQALGPQAVQPRRFRFGASGLLNDIDALLSGRSAPPKPVPGSY